MPLRPTTARRILTVFVTALLSSAMAIGAAHAGDEFLLVDDLPPDPTWAAGDIKEGEPEIEEFCVGGVITAEGTRHRPYQTELDTWARQHIVTSSNEAKSAKLQHRLNRAVRGCAEAYEEENPDSTAIFRRYGKQGVADGVAVYGIFTDDQGVLSANLFAVGRDSIDVTVVRYGRIGRESDVPVRAFERTAKRAVALLVP